MGNTASGKLIKEVATDARALLSASSKDRYQQVVSRRMDMEKQLLEVTKHKEELLRRRAMGVKAIVDNYAAKKSRMLEDFANRQVPSSMGSSMTGDATATVTAPNDRKGAAPGLPSPGEILQRMHESSREREIPSSSSPSSSSSSSSAASSRETPPP